MDDFKLKSKQLQGAADTRFKARWRENFKPDLCFIL